MALQHRDRVVSLSPDPEVSIDLPCLDEAETLGTCIAKAQAAIRRHGLHAEIVVADNGSHHDSPAIAERLGARLVRVAARGYGAALLGGFEAARGAYIVMGDADDSYDFGAIMPFVERLREGHDLVMGCRFPRGGGRILPGAMPWSHRFEGNPVLSALARRFFRTTVSDFQCGLRALRRDLVARLDLRTTGMEFASEMVVKAALAGVRIAEVPITLHPDGRRRRPHLRTWRDGWRYLRFLLLYSPVWFFVLPGLVCLGLGLLAGGVLLTGPVLVRGVVFDTSTLLVAAMSVLVGFKLVVFGTLARLFAVSEGLLPRDRWSERVRRTATLEAGLLLGTTVAAIGLGLLVWSVAVWRHEHFGPRSYPRSLRRVIPAVTTVTLGVEIVFSSFFMSVLGLRRR